MKSLIRLLLIVLFLSDISFPQYTVKDMHLAQTTYLRNFDAGIISGYLESNKAEEVNAALLSVAQSSDTSFAESVIKLDFKKHFRLMCFALGELGPCKLSSEFLYSKFETNRNDSIISHSILDALGKTGDEKYYNNITGNYFTSRMERYNGISIALYNFFSRGIGNKAISDKILLNEINNFRNNPKRYFEAAFALYRIGVPKQKASVVTEELQKLFFNNSIHKLHSFLSPAAAYLLAALRMEKFFPFDHKLFHDIISSNKYDIKIEAAKSICYFNFSNKNELLDYLSLLDDSNSNVATELAASLKHLTLNKSLSSFLNGFILKAINNSKYDSSIKGELFLSYLQLFNPAFKEAENKFAGQISKEYFYRATVLYKNSTEALNYLLNNFDNTGTKEQVNILTSLLEFQPGHESNNKLTGIINKTLSSDKSALISISAEGIDSSFISNNKITLEEIITLQTKKYLNNPDFYESLISLANLSGKLDTNFYQQIILSLHKSELYPVKKFAFVQLHLPLRTLKKTDGQFSKFWKLAFRYKGAVIETSKGNVRIEFLPQYAPVSVGNFCLLAKNKFFNNNSFHRVVPGFVIQGGDPTETGWGGPGYDIVSEFSPLEYDAGMVGMASAGKDTEGSQWFITTGAFPHLNGRYTIFAKVTSGQNIVNQTEQDDKIIKIKLF